MFHFHTRVLTITMLAGSLLLAGPAGAASDPIIACGQTVAKTMASCVKKVTGIHANCYKKTGVACLTADEKIAAAKTSAAGKIEKKCADGATILAAGYGDYNTPATLGTHFGERCAMQAKDIANRTFDSDGSKFTGADETGKACLLTAAKAAAKVFSAPPKAVAKCIAEGCTFDFSETETKAAANLDKKCPTFAAVVGTTSAQYIALTVDAGMEAAAAPCDPLDTSRCLFPFPNDYFTVSGADTVHEGNTTTGRHLAVGPKAMTAYGNGVSVVPTRWNEADGFSIGPMMLLQNTTIDLTMTGAAPITDIAQSLSPTAPFVLIDAETGDQQILWVERDLRGDTIADQPIIGRVAKNLEENHRYIVALRNMKDSGGLPVAAPASFALYRDITPTTIVPVELRRAHMEDIFSILTDAGVTRSSLYLAWDFTTQSSDSVANRMLAMRDDAFTILGGSAPAFTVTTTTNAPTPAIFRYVNGTFQVPNYLNLDNQTLRTDVNLVPENAGDFFTANFRCVIPNSATTGGLAPAVPARISLYGHGLLGSHTEVTAGNVLAMASEHNMIFCATDWTGFASFDSTAAIAVLTDFTAFPGFIDRQHQGMLNMMFLGRLMKHASGFASDAAFQVGGQSMLDTSNLYYDGNSQGGILGGVLAAFIQDGVSRMTLGVPGMNYSTLLNRSVDFTSFDSTFMINYERSTDRNLLLSFAQLIWDRTDPNGHINHVTSDTYDVGTLPKTLLYQVAFGDHQVAPVTAEVAARSNGAHIHAPTLVPGKIVPEVTPYYDIPAIPAYPYSGSALVIWDSGNPAPPIGNVPPDDITDPDGYGLEACVNDDTGDPHSCPRSDPDARTQKSEFLKPTGIGAVVDVCGGAACEAQ